MIWACTKCGHHCCEVYPLEDKTVVNQGLCPPCYKAERDKKIQNLRDHGNIRETEETKIWPLTEPIKSNIL